MAHPELSELEARINELTKENYELEMQLRALRSQLPRVKNADEHKLQQDVISLGQTLSDIKLDRNRLEEELQEAQRLAERLMAEKSNLKKQCDGKIDELKDQLDIIKKEGNENYRLYIEQKELAMLTKADLDRLLANGRSMDMSSMTSDGNMSIMSERDKEIMRLTSMSYQMKIDAEKKSRELQAELDKAREQVGKRDDMIRELVTRNSVVDKKAKQLEEQLVQERTKINLTDHGDDMGLQSRIEDLAERHLKLSERSISDSVAELYASRTDLMNVSARPDESIVSFSYNNMSMSMSVAFKEFSVDGRGDIDTLAATADLLFQRLKKAANTLRAVLGHESRIVAELEASIRELEASIQTSFVEGVSMVKKDIERLQTLVKTKEDEIEEKNQEILRLGQDLREEQSESERLEKELKEAVESEEALHIAKEALKTEYEARIERLYDELENQKMESEENHRLYMEEKENRNAPSQIEEIPIKQEYPKDIKQELSPVASISEEAPKKMPAGWSLAKCIERLDKADASANNIVQLLKQVGTLPVPPRTLETLMFFGRQARDEAYKCAQFLRAYNDRSDFVMSDKVRAKLEEELKSINEVLKTTVANARRFQKK